MSKKKKVALLHTSLVFIQRERLMFELFNELLPDVELVNIIDDSMLKEVMEKNEVTPYIIRQMSYYVLAADSMNVDAIFSTCSSLGPAVDVAKHLVSTPVIKIDDGMAEKAAKDGKHIVCLATVPTTLTPTINLIKEKAENFKTNIEIKGLLAEGAFDLLMNNNIEEHDQLVAKCAEDAAEWADMLVLSQCSMARLAPKLEKTVKLPVLSSPRLGITHLKEVLYA